VRDQAVRVELGIPLRNACRIIGIAYHTLRMYEIDPAAIRSPEKREACALFYAELRRLMERAPLTRETRETA
jgi:hypothetical protein